VIQAASTTMQTTNDALSQTIAPTMAGDLVVVAVTVNTNAATTVTTITDNAPGGGNVYTSANQRSNDTSCDNVVELWYAKNVVAGATSVKVTTNLVVQMDMWVLELAGLDRMAPFDTGAVANSQPAATILTAPAVTPSKPNAVVISTVCSCAAVTGLRAASPFTALNVHTGNTTAYFLTTSVGSHGAVWNATNGTWNASTVAFK
jgi:hypothetical protein